MNCILSGARRATLFATVSIVALATLAGCASAPTDSEWRPIDESDRLISFDATPFELQQSVYSGRLFSYNQASEYGIWRDQGGQAKYASVQLTHLRRNSNYVFAYPDDPMSEIIGYEFEEEITEQGASRTLTSGMGEYEAVPFKVEQDSCVALRWYGWKTDEWIPVTGAGGQLGKGQVKAFLCEPGEYPMPTARMQQFADAISVRERHGW